MKTISTAQTEAIVVSTLGFDRDCTDLATPEVLAAVIRKAASFLCPCTNRVLLRAVTKLLQPLRPDDNFEDAIGDAIDSIVGYGDLVEARDINTSNEARLLYLAPPSFIPVSDRLFLIAGIVPDGLSPLPPHLGPNLTEVLCTRRLHVDDPKEAIEVLIQAGFIRLKTETWLKYPPLLSAAELVARYDEALSQSGPSGAPENVSILDPSTSVKYYKGRWKPLKRQTGRFLARRSQAYGSQLWCYLEAIDGIVTRLLDFPLFEKQWNAFDEAWHLSQARDAMAEHPQLFKVIKNASSGTATIDFFSPIPAWATRRWDSIGKRAIPNAALCSYVFAEADVETECRFAMERMWLKHA